MGPIVPTPQDSAAGGGEESKQHRNNGTGCNQPEEPLAATETPTPKFFDHDWVEKPGNSVFLLCGSTM